MVPILRSVCLQMSPHKKPHAFSLRWQDGQLTCCVQWFVSMWFQARKMNMRCAANTQKMKGNIYIYTYMLMYFEQWNQLGIEQTQLNVRFPPLWAKAQPPHPKTKNHSHSDTNADPKMKRNRYVYTQGQQQDSQNQTWPLQPSSLQAKCAKGVAELQRRREAVADDKSKWNNLEELLFVQVTVTVIVWNLIDSPKTTFCLLFSNVVDA